MPETYLVQFQYRLYLFLASYHQNIVAFGNNWLQRVAQIKIWTNFSNSSENSQLTTWNGHY